MRCDLVRSGLPGGLGRSRRGLLDRASFSPATQSWGNIRIYPAGTGAVPCASRAGKPRAGPDGRQHVPRPRFHPRGGAGRRVQVSPSAGAPGGGLGGGWRPRWERGPRGPSAERTRKKGEARLGEKGAGEGVAGRNGWGRRGRGRSGRGRRGREEQPGGRARRLREKCVRLHQPRCRRCAGSAADTGRAPHDSGPGTHDPGRWSPGPENDEGRACFT